MINREAELTYIRKHQDAKALVSKKDFHISSGRYND